MHLLPPICGADHALWRTTAPLIYFWIVEMYNPERVAQQFGSYQQVPPYLRDTNDALHDKTNGAGKNWPQVHVEYLQMWNERHNHCLTERRPYDQSKNGEYMRWPLGASTLYLSSPDGVPNTHSSAEEVRLIVTSIIERYRDVVDKDSRAFARDALHRCRAIIQDLLEPVNDTIFAAFDGEQIPQQEVRQAPNRDPGPSNGLVNKKPRDSASTS